MPDDKAKIPNPQYARLATAEQIQRTAAALEANHIHAVVVENGLEAKRAFFELVPDGAEVFLGASVSLETLGIRDEIEKSGRFDALRPKMFALDRKTQAREFRKLGSAPDFAAGSVQAVTEEGQVLIASHSGSQLGPYAAGAGKVIWVVGSQKIVKDLDEGLKRIQEYCLPREEIHMQQLYHLGTAVNKILIVSREIRPGRVTMILVKEELGS
jgi:hypothetical protein